MSRVIVCVYTLTIIIITTTITINIIFEYRSNSFYWEKKKMNEYKA